MESKKEENKKLKLCSISQLFMFANKDDKILVIVGAVVAFANGFVYPIFSVIFGDMTNAFTQPDPQKRLDVALENTIKFLVVGAIAFSLSFVQFSTFMISATRQTVAFRKAYFQALIRQDVGWHDKVNANELGSKVSNDAVQIQNAIGEKFGTLIMFSTMFIGGVGVGFYKGWLMSVILVAALPAVALGAIFMVVSIAQGQAKINAQNRQSGAIVEEYIQNIKTVKSLVSENFIIDRFKKVVLDSQGPLNRFNLMIGIGLGSVFFFLFLDYALCFYVGSELVGNKVVNDNTGKIYNVGDVMTIFFAIMIGGFGLGQGGPASKAITQGRLSMQNYLDVLEQQPTIIQDDPTKKKGFEIEGTIELNDVVFQYPTKKSDQGLNVLQNVSMKFLKNKKNSIVGESGSGKSTIMQLIERYYDCDQGQLLIDGLDIKEYNLRELRQQIGYVGQEPVLFNTTIRQNLYYGREQATEEEMIDALKQANAWEFVRKTEKGIDTEVGQGGSNFSGGQKQRIAIARAILKKPKILLLDEATSALDKQNETIIQQTLDKISQNITTITIAHRLSTIINSDLIFVIDKGHLVQQGTHEELNNQIGKYKSLVALQNVGQDRVDTQYLDVADEHNADVQMTHQNHNVESQNLVQDEDPDMVVSKEAKLQQEKEEELLKKKKEKEAVEMVNKRLGQFKSRMKDTKINLLIVLGLFLSTCYGMTMPVTGQLLSEFIGESANPYSSKFKDNVIKITIYMVLISFAILITQGLGHYVHSIAGQSVTDSLRIEAFQSLIQQRLGYFDKKENAPGVLSSTISQDSQQINSMVSVLYGVMISAASSFILGIILAFLASPRIAGIALGLSPLMIIAGAIEAQLAQGFSGKVDAKFKQGSSVINETFCNIRTILSFSNELFVQNLYSDKIQASVSECNKNGIIAGICFGFSQFSQFLMYAVIFYCGAIFINDYGLSISDLFTAMFAIMFAAFATGNANQYLPDYGKMISSAKAIFEIIDMKTETQFMSEQQKGSQIDYDSVKGNIEFIDVSFKYPERKQYVFKNLSLKIEAGQKVAFVGPSGCGKSTIFQLLLRFYEVDQGQILIDGIDIKEFDIDKLRKLFGVVSQEPVLFSGSVLYNVKFNTRCSQQEVDNACKYANAYDFVVNDEFDIDDNNKPDAKNDQDDNKGFNRKVGIKGSQISGGQKQRLAIARAILKNPLILLLDEATSALDSNNEKLVQESLDRIMSQKTSIVIAHRISTIINSEVIYMFSEGKIVEQGNHQQLMDNKSYFFKFQQGSI